MGKIIKNLCDQNIKLINKHLEIHRDFCHKTTFHLFDLSTYDKIKLFKGLYCATYSMPMVILGNYYFFSKSKTLEEQSEKIKVMCTLC